MRNGNSTCQFQGRHRQEHGGVQPGGLARRTTGATSPSATSTRSAPSSTPLEIRDEIGYEPAMTVAQAARQGRRARRAGLLDVGLSDMAAMRRRDQAGRPGGAAGLAVAGRHLGHPALPRDRRRGARRRARARVSAPSSTAPTRIRARAKTRRRWRRCEMLPGVTALRPKLVQRMAFRRSFSEGLAAFELEPGGKAAAELEALARRCYG